MIKYILYISIILLGEVMGNSLPKYYTKVLKNGLQVVAIPLNAKTKVISTNIIYKVGSRNEVMGKSGIAHMLEHMNFKSTKNLKAGEFDKIITSYGGNNNASTSFDLTHYYINSSSKNLSKSTKLLAELMANLNLKAEEFATEREVVAQERLWRTDNSPMGYLYFKLFNLAFDYHPYHWTPIGFMQDIKTWTIDDIREFHTKYYAPNNAVLVVAGDITKEEVFKYAKKYFKDIKPSANLDTTVHNQEMEQNSIKEMTVFKDSQVQMLALAYHIPNLHSKDHIALSALSDILSGSPTSRLDIKLKDEQSLINTIYCYNMEQVDPSLFLFLAVCNPNIKAKDVKNIILQEIQKIQKGDISDKELQKVKIATKSMFIYSLESSETVANVIGRAIANGSIDNLMSYEDDISKLTKEDIIKVAKKYFKPNNSITLILKSEENEK